ncbi:MAG: hypothetical protein WC807_20905 [Hyphomicrobium sp.]|jgi:hypothetical protein
MKRPVKGLARWDGKVLRGFFTISKADKLRQPVVRRAKRAREPSAPAPGLRPPGMRGPQPQRQGYAMESWQQTQRRTLRAQLIERVRGLMRGPGSLMNVDWERFKLSEALWSRARREKAARTLKKTPQRAVEQKVSRPQRAKVKAQTRVRPAPAFEKVQQRGRITPEKAYAQQVQQKSAQAPQKLEKGQLRSSTEHLFKPSAATERASQQQRDQLRDQGQGRQRER